MYPDTDYAEARGSFLRPVPQPVDDPRSAPSKTVTVNCDWLPYIRGALQQLLLQATWQPGVLSLDDLQGRVAVLISLFEECSGASPSFACPYDFVHSSDGLPAVQAQRGDLVSPWASFVPSIGWNSVSSFEPGGPAYWQHVGISVPLGAVVELGIVQCVLTGITPGSNYAGDYHANPSGMLAYHGGALVGSDFLVSDAIPHPDFVHNHDFGGILADTVKFFYLFGVTSTNPADGFGNIAGIEITGHATGFTCP